MQVKGAKSEYRLLNESEFEYLLYYKLAIEIAVYEYQMANTQVLSWQDDFRSQHWTDMHREGAHSKGFKQISSYRIIIN